MNENLKGKELREAMLKLFTEEQIKSVAASINRYKAIENQREAGTLSETNRKNVMARWGK